MFRITGAAALAVTTIATATAHPGHGEPGPAHYVTEPSHVVPVVMGAAAVFCAVIAVGAWRRGRLVRDLAVSRK